MNNERITWLTSASVPCDNCILGNDDWETEAVVRVEMKTEEHPLHMPLNLCGNHAEVEQIPDEPLES
jgi:hypothetical protein